MSVVKVEATRAKSTFAKLPARARASDLAITRHGHVQAYVVSPDRYRALVSASSLGKGALQKLDDDFEAMVAAMQTSAHQKAVKSIETLPLEQILASGAFVSGKSRRRRAGVKARKTPSA